MSHIVSAWWAVEWVGGSAFEWHPLAEVVDRNGRNMLDGQLTPHLLLALVPTMEDAQCVARDMKRVLAKRTASKDEADGEGGGG